MAEERERIPVSVETFEHRANVLAHFADRYRSLAEALRKGGHASLDTPNEKTMLASIKHVKRHVNLAFQAFDELVLGEGIEGAEETYEDILARHGGDVEAAGRELGQQAAAAADQREAARSEAGKKKRRKSVKAKD